MKTDDSAVDRCRICGAGESKEILTKRFGTTESTWWKCERCGVHRIVPYPSEQELAQYYDDAYQEKQCSGSVDHRLRYSAEYQSTIFKEYACSLADVGIDRGELAGLTILDYGCADGTFLDFARSEGTDPERLYGVDISPKMVERAVGKGYRAVTIADGKAIYDVRFDLVTMWDTLEHLLDPRAVVEGLKRAISSTTRLLVQTPRIGLLSECLGEAFEHYLPMEHVHLFPRATFTSLFEGMGFEADKLASFGANAPAVNIPAPYKQAFDRLAKTTDQGATQLGLFRLAGPRGM